MLNVLHEQFLTVSDTGESFYPNTRFAGGMREERKVQESQGERISTADSGVCIWGKWNS